ncbi:MAG: hypothetical protein ACREMY_30075, partial [bacterium]
VWVTQQWESDRAERALLLDEASSFLESATVAFEAERRYVLLHRAESIRGTPEEPEFLAALQLLDARGARLAIAIPEMNGDAERLRNVVYSLYQDLWEADWADSLEERLEMQVSNFDQERETYVRAALRLSHSDERLTTENE